MNTDAAITHQDLMDSLPLPYFETDTKGMIKEMSLIGYEFTGYSSKDIARGLNLLKLISPKDHETFKSDLRHLMGNSASRHYEYTLLRKDGSKLPIIMYLKPIVSEGRTSGVGGLILDIAERKRKEESLILSEQKYRTLFEESRDPIIITTADGTAVDINPATENLLKHTRDEILGQNIRKFYVDPSEHDKFSDEIARNGFISDLEIELRRKNGEIIECIVASTAKTTDEFGRVLIHSSLHDITEKNRLAAQLRQAQKMESVGRLAGGISHDFNNLLTVIKGYTELALMSVDKDNNLYNKLTQIEQAAERASNLTKQLLAYSRKQTLQPVILDLNLIIDSMKDMLRRSIGEDIILQTDPDENLWRVKVDPGQIEQIIANLVVNARDAMPNGGSLTIRTANVVLDDDYIHTHPGSFKGPFVMLSISDTGMGMTEDVKANVFEPFFTTKEVGKGTGLGLSTVYGIVKQSEGYVWVESEPEKGATFDIFLPRVEGELKELKPAKKYTETPGGSEVVLVVEDDEALRRLMSQTIRRLGYKVYEAESGSEAFVLAKKLDKPVDLILTDVIMPQFSGLELIEMIHTELWHDVKVIFMSGYSNDPMIQHKILDQGIPFMKKPFSLDAIARKVREVIDD